MPTRRTIWASCSSEPAAWTRRSSALRPRSPSGPTTHWRSRTSAPRSPSEPLNADRRCPVKPFHCDHCGALVFFESVSCVSCGHALGFAPDLMEMVAFEAAGERGWRSLAAKSQGRVYRLCANGRDHAVCNWYVPEEEPEGLCAACRLNHVIPDPSAPEQRERWHRAEVAKRRLVYTLRRLGLPTAGDAATGRPALRVRFLADVPGGPPVVTGHDNGVITLNLAEADDAEREKRRVQLFEPQRTLVGHFRHESGHYYWSVLVEGSPWHEPFR